MAYNLYKPLYEHNYKDINTIVSIQGWLYRRIAYIVIGGACILMCFFPIIFAKAQLPLWYAYGSFIALLISALLGYFVNYKQIVLSADQKEYKITLIIQGTKIIKVILQILAVRFFRTRLYMVDRIRNNHDLHNIVYLKSKNEKKNIHGYVLIY